MLRDLVKIVTADPDYLLALGDGPIRGRSEGPTARESRIARIGTTAAARAIARPRATLPAPIVSAAPVRNREWKCAMFDRRTILTALLVAMATRPLRAMAPARAIPLWPGSPPGGGGPSGPVTTSRTGAISNIAVPQLEIFAPARPNGTAMLVAAGGGYAEQASIGSCSHPCSCLHPLRVRRGADPDRAPRRCTALSGCSGSSRNPSRVR